MTIKLNWPLLGAIVASIAGVVGTILTPIYGSSLTTQIQAVLQALSALLIAIPTWHVASTAATTSKMSAALKCGYPLAGVPRGVPTEISDL